MAADGGSAACGKRVVICGAGIIGSSVAYYLSQRGIAATVIEREAPACAASGKAGGFLALDWNDASPVGPLARLSYGLHQQLAHKLGAERIGYRGVHTLQVAAVEKAPPGGVKAAKYRGDEEVPSWVDGHVLAISSMGEPRSTAQVHPALLTRALLDAAKERGAQLVQGCVEGLKLNKDGSVGGVLVGGGEVPADAVVIAMGPWSDAARRWLPGLPAIGGQKYHSVVLRPAEPVTGHMLFTAFKYADGRTVEPEVYPRPDGTVYVCGEPQGSVPLPASPGGVTVLPELCDNIRRVAGSIASGLREAPMEASQACYLPLSPDGLPVIGEVPGCRGAYVATGHSCWGILNGPATGLALAELVADGKATSLDIAAFSPARFS